MQQRAREMQKSRNFLYLLIFLLLSSVLNANNDKGSCREPKAFLNDYKRGWFVGEKPCEKPKEEPIKQTKEKPLFKAQLENEKPSSDINGIEYKYIENKTVFIPWSDLDMLHADTLLQLEEENRKVALSNPTVENLTEFKKYQKYLTKKALKFSQVSTIAGKQNSELSNWASEVPTSRVAITQKRKYRESQVKKTFEYFKDNIIILMGDSKTCPYCAKQREIMKMFESEYKISYKLIDIQTNRAFAQQMKIQRTPDLFLLFRENNNEPKIVRIGTGIHTVSEMKDNLLIGLQTLKKVDEELAFRWGKQQ